MPLHAIPDKLPTYVPSRRLVLVTAIAAASFGITMTTPAAAEDGAAQLPAIRINADAIEDATGPVEGYAAKRSRTASKSEAPLIEIPQSISVIGRQEMEDRNVQSMPEAVAYTAGVRIGSQGIDSRVDDISIRGFDASSWTNNLYLDGLRLPLGGQWTTPQIDAYGLERIEVLKGPAAVLYGQVAPGGLVNMVSKRPSVDQVREVLLQTTRQDQIKGAFDVGGSLDDENRLLGRVVSSYNDGNTEIDHTDLERTYLAPSLSIALSQDTSLTLLSYYQKDDGGSTFQFLPLDGTYRRTAYGYIDRDTYVGEPDWNIYEREQWSVGYEFAHRFSDTLRFEQNAKYTEQDMLFRTVVTAGQAVEPDFRTVRRRAVQGDGGLYGVALDNRLHFTFNTGGASHDVLVGADYLLTDWKLERDLVNTRARPIAPIDLYTPVYSGAAGFREALVPQVHNDSHDKQLGIYLQDLIAIDRWRITLGVRRDDFENLLTDSLAETPEDAKTKTDDNAITGRAGVTYLFDNGVAPYASHATSFEPQSGIDANRNAFEPTEGEQIEVGVKYQPAAGNLLLTASVFDLRQKNLLIADNNPPVDSWCYSEEDGVIDNSCERQAGETRTRGAELEGKFALTDGLSLTGAYTLLDTEILKTSGTDKGNQLARVPENAAALWLDQRWQQGALKGLGLGGGARYTGSSYGDTDNLYKTDSYTLFDASISYDLGMVGINGLLLSLSANNIADKEYLTFCTEFGCGYGSGRSVVANARYRW